LRTLLNRRTVPRSFSSSGTPSEFTPVFSGSIGTPLYSRASAVSPVDNMPVRKIDFAPDPNPNPNPNPQPSSSLFPSLDDGYESDNDWFDLSDEGAESVDNSL